MSSLYPITHNHAIQGCINSHLTPFIQDNKPSWAHREFTHLLIISSMVIANRFSSQSVRILVLNGTLEFIQVLCTRLQVYCQFLHKSIMKVEAYLWVSPALDSQNNNNVIYIAPFTMCSRRLEESRKKMRFKVVFEPVHMINSTDTARQPIPKMRPSHRKGTIARLFFGTRDLKCNGQIRTETVFSFVDTRLKIWRQITRRTEMESFESLDNELEKNLLLDWEPVEGL